uniref:DUF6598 domain-containing protein n=1 Tax=Oryza brachyantha TaxID=4533 RepID=J3MWB4_ORYBR
MVSPRLHLSEVDNTMGHQARLLRNKLRLPPAVVHRLENQKRLPDALDGPWWSGRDSGFPVGGTTITVFDGKRGQIIYKYDEDQHDDDHTQVENLVLTGPYRAISADGSFAVEIETSPTDIKYWEWDCSDDEIVYDELYTENLGPVDITYVVLSEALEATVEVKLPETVSTNGGESSPPRIFGYIAAQTKVFDRASVLFSRAADRAVPIPSDLRVPLARSVVAVPSWSKLQIDVGLYLLTQNATTKFEHTVKLDCTNHSQRIQTNNGDVLQVNVSWYPQFTDCGEKTRRSSPSGD